MTATAAEEIGFDHEWESKEYYNEVLEFVRRDIASARHMADLSPAIDHRDRIFQDILKRYLLSLKECLDTATRLDRSEQPNFVRITLESFPILARHLTSALQQRREQYFPRPFGPPLDHNVFAPSEATLDYPVTMRAAEALNEDYHTRLEPFLRPIAPDCLPPLVNISGAGTTKLETPAISTWISGDYSGSLRRYLNLVCITLPRWSSQAVRTFAAAAHEHMHRLLNVGLVADRDIGVELNRCAARTGATQSSEASQELRLRVAERFERFYGRPIIDMLNLRHLLIEHLMQFFERMGIPEPFLNEAFLNTSAAGSSLREIIAQQHATELMADIGAVVIAGPAYPFTYRALYSGPLESAAADLQRMNLQKMPSYAHPPWLVRITLMIAVLKHMGFEETAKQLTIRLAPDLESAASLTVIREYINALQFAAEKYLNAFADLVGELAELGVPGHSYSLRLRNASEQDLLMLWKRTADDVEHNGRYLPGQLDHVRPADLVNAIWTKRMNEERREPQHRLAWRMALRNSLRGNA